MRLHEIQTSVHVAKDKRNDFGGYNYRTAEGILAAIKSVLGDGETITCTDDVIEVAGQIFVCSTATIAFADGTSVPCKGWAMHPLTKKGMDPSQITGSASSYARKYALSGLAALDDGSADPDSSTKPADNQGPQRISPDQFRKLRDKSAEADVAHETICEAFNITALPELPAADFDRVMKKLAKTIENAKPKGGDIDDEIPY